MESKYGVLTLTLINIEMTNLPLSRKLLGHELMVEEGLMEATIWGLGLGFGLDGCISNVIFIVLKLIGLAK